MKKQTSADAHVTSATHQPLYPDKAGFAPKKAFGVGAVIPCQKDPQVQSCNQELSADIRQKLQ